MKMARTSHRRNARKQGQRLREMAQEAHRRNAAKICGPLIPDKVLRALASLNLPASEFVYTACLEKLLREVPR
jgi:hypothetical protein